MIRRHGWHLLFHDCLIGQLRKLEDAVARAKAHDFAWVNDEHSLRSSGNKSDPYAVFQKMLLRGHPPDDWSSLLVASKVDWKH